MSKALIFAFVVIMAVAALSAPMEEPESHQELEALVRLPRATCDLLSGFGVGDSACALHCIGHGRRGGYCEKGTCHCR
ncbi:arthropod defensin domain-containing protein [Phthorimaea operculella]|nr:arthropod defensin domain-containing protein [Phthorimaea operculella]